MAYVKYKDYYGSHVYTVNGKKIKTLARVTITNKGLTRTYEVDPSLVTVEFLEPHSRFSHPVRSTDFLW